MYVLLPKTGATEIVTASEGPFQRGLDIAPTPIGVKPILVHIARSQLAEVLVGVAGPRVIGMSIDQIAPDCLRPIVLLELQMGLAEQK